MYDGMQDDPTDFYGLPADKALYLGHLAIDPLLQSHGIGKWCMKHVETIARKLGCDAIRFDAITTHPWLKKFYLSQNYSSSATVKPSKWDLLCFESV